MSEIPQQQPRHLAAGTPSPRLSATKEGSHHLSGWLYRLLLLVSAGLCAAYLTLFLSACQPDLVVHPLGLFAASLAVFLLLAAVFWHSRHCFDFVIRWRYPLALGILVACVALKVSGSSVAAWSSLIGGAPCQGTLLGTSRNIRSDEWIVFTPFAASQARLGFPAVNEALRAAPTDMTMVYAQPAWAVATLFRPFLWGYLFLGFERGLSFFWVSRLLALWLAVFELSHLLTRDSGELAAFAATLTAFSPAVQWWFSVNGTAELFVFGAGLVLALKAFLDARPGPRRWLFAGLLGWLLWCYAFILYPSWQIPFAYLFGGLGVWVLIEHHRQAARRGHAGNRGRTFTQSVVPLVVCVAVWSAVAGIALFLSASTISAVMSTAYPGARNLTGGLPAVSYLCNNFVSLSSAIKADAYEPIVPEAVGYVSLFPMGIALGAYVAVRHRDLPSLCMFVPTALLGVYMVVGLPSPLAQVTLLSKVQGERCMTAVGFADILLLVRSLVVLDRVPSPRVPRRTRAAAAVLGSLAYAAAACRLAHLCQPDVEDAAQLVMTFGCLASLALLAFLPRDAMRRGHLSRGTCLLVASGVICLSGLFVNPVQQGTAALTNSDLVSTVSSLVQSDPNAVWVADGTDGSPHRDPFVGQALATAGAHTINSVNAYPDLDRWSQLDPSGTYRDIYNRYAFVNVELSQSTSFEQVQVDIFTVHVTPDDLARLGVTYLCSRTDLTVWDTDGISFEPVTQSGAFTIYRLDQAK